MANLIRGQRTAGRISQRRLDDVEKRVDLVDVIAAHADGRLAEGHVVDLLGGQATLLHHHMVSPGKPGATDIVWGHKGLQALRFGEPAIRRRPLGEPLRQELQ